MTEKTNLPPIGDLFKDSWEVFKKNILNLLFLFLISVGTYIAIVAIVAIISLVLGVGSTLMNGQADPSMLFTNPATVIGFVVILIITVLAMIIVGMLFQIATYRLVFHENKKESLITLIKTSAPQIWPVFVVSFVSGLLTLGGYGLLVIPGIIFSLLFSFSAYEVLFNNQRGLNALRRSLALFSTNFWGILGRLAIFVLITILVSFAIPKDNGMGVLSAIINVVISWFGLCYSITLYKQVAKGNEHLPGKSLTGITIASTIGLVLLIVFASAATSFYINTVLPSLKNSQDIMNNPSFQNMNQGKMPTEQEMEEIIKNLPENESMIFEDTSI